MSKSVVVLGGGVAGLTAAHELAERGFKVTVLELRPDTPGGKARSYGAADSGTGGRPDLPAEHGFRFFPGFYKHIPDTMSRIPFGNNRRGVLDNLVQSTRAEIARAGKPSLVLPTRPATNIAELELWLKDALAPISLGLPPSDLVHFVGLLVKLLSSSDERRYGEYEYESWWEFSGAANRSKAFQQFLADGLTRSLVAAQAQRMSARTGGYILIQLLLSMASPGTWVDRVLNGPTNDVWIDPWKQHICSEFGVDYRFGAEVTKIDLDGSRVSAVRYRQGGRARTIKADWVVAAFPVEVMSRLVASNPHLAEQDHRLGELHKLTVRWMNGVMFYLNRRVPVTHGHVIYIDSPWSLTSISQAQFWPHTKLQKMGDGTVRDILSVDVSEWTRPGMLYDRPAMQCDRDEIVAEVWSQLKAHLNSDQATVLSDSDLVGAFVDDDIVIESPHSDIDLEPLLVNTTGSWDIRPTTDTAIENLFLASDYVRTYTDLATMEGANEAARRATNCILDATNSDEQRCAVWPLHEPRAFAPLRELDAVRYRLFSPSASPVGPGPGR